MIGGQVIDLLGEECRLPLDTLCRLHRGKTGALIKASATLGCLAAGLSLHDEKTKAAEAFAEGIGLAFQIVDDVLDATADESELGKPVGSDEKQHKTTFLSYYTPSEALALATEETERAIAAIATYKHAETLVDLAHYLIDRRC
jgi:geranylgeranyl diphosphate synthase type II